MARIEHFYFRIPGWFSFLDIYADAVREAKPPAHFVEVGCWKGKSASFMAVEIANSGKAIKFDCVDHWLGSETIMDDPDVVAGRLYEVFLRNTRNLAAYLNARRMPSLEAAPTYPNHSLDLVLIDGAHDLDNVRADIAAWRPKLKVGATLAGDDWGWDGVHRAVREVFPDSAIEVLGKGNGLHWRVRGAGQ